MIQDLFAFRRRLRGDAITNLGRRIENAAVVADLGQSAQAANRGGGGERLGVSVIDLRRKAGGPDLVETKIFRQLKREAIGADGPVKRDEHLSLLSIPDAGDLAKQPSSLGEKELLMIVRVKIGRQIHHDGTVKAAINVVGNNSFKDRSLEDAIETALVSVEAVWGNRSHL